VTFACIKSPYVAPSFKPCYIGRDRSGGERGAKEEQTYAIRRFRGNKNLLR
jgi:hypothetical protein